MSYYSVTFSLQNILFTTKNTEYRLGTPYLHIDI